MRVKSGLFAVMADVVGARELELEFPTGRPAGSSLSVLSQRFPNGDVVGASP